jgi:hypothetical protein
MSELFGAPRPRPCKCGAARVDASDQARVVHGDLIVHGLQQCFAMKALGA